MFYGNDIDFAADNYGEGNISIIIMRSYDNVIA
jgi:hypothetical protein